MHRFIRGVLFQRLGGAQRLRSAERNARGCRYPGCRSTKPIPDEAKDKIKALMPARPKREMPKVDINETCPECGAPMELRSGRRGYFPGCSMYGKTKCKGSREVSPELMEQFPETPA
jgi:DNA topoisomerase-1